ncbi:MAG: LysR family transcriptional regulator [Pseudomonadota bacterium]|nr:LysR family transcriptional regulator [Pseudomonadota bacterium]
MDKKHIITLKQLRALRAIGDLGTFAEAAKALNLTPPAVTVQIRQLEQALGSKVLLRAPNGSNTPTAVGVEILKLAVKIDINLENSLNTIESIKSGQVGSVTLGVVSTAKYFAPWIVAKAKLELIGLDIELFVGNRNDIISALEQNKIDLAIMGRPPRHPSVEAEVIGEHPHVLIAESNHSLTSISDNSSRLYLSAFGKLLENETIIIREQGSGTRILMDRFLGQFSDEIVFTKKEMSSNETMKQAVMAGLGIALISASTIEAELRDKRLVCLDLPGLPIIRQWFLVYKNSSINNPATKAFKNFILDQKEKLLRTGINSNQLIYNHAAV